MKAGERKLWILGLPHSGTTIFWRCWRQDTRALCFDEPLTANLGACFPRNNQKGTFDEYIEQYGSRANEFWKLYQPIDAFQELDAHFTPGQERYLQQLVALSEFTVIDETHIHLHLDALRKLVPNVHVVHLYRRASTFVTSHLKPSWSHDGNLARRFVRRVRDTHNRFSFWGRRGFPPGMDRDVVIGGHESSKFGLLLSQSGYDTRKIMSGSAVVRLLAYWHYHYHYLEQQGPAAFTDRFMSLAYEDFAMHPAATMHRLYEWLGLPAPRDADYSGVYPPKPAFMAHDRRWREAARIAGFSKEELETLL